MPYDGKQHVPPSHLLVAQYRLFKNVSLLTRTGKISGKEVRSMGH